MPEYLQMGLRESLGLEHNPNRVRVWNGRSETGPLGIADRRSLVSTVAGQKGIDVYVSGRALVRYLAEVDPIMLEAAARRIRHGVWRDREGMALWWSLMDDLLSKHEMAYAEWNTRNGAAHPGFGGGVQEIEGETMLDQFLAHRSVRTATLSDWIDSVCEGESSGCLTENGNHGFTLNGIEATDKTSCYVDETIKDIDWRGKHLWLPYVVDHWDDGRWVDECAPADPANAFWLSN